MTHKNRFSRRAALLVPFAAALAIAGAGGALAQSASNDDKAITVIAADLPDSVVRLSLSLAERIGVPEDGKLTIAVVDADGITLVRSVTTTGRQPYVLDLPVTDHTAWPLTVTGTFGAAGDGGVLSASAVLDETAPPAVVDLSLIINRTE